jgi:hypothetical protein
MLTIQIDNAEIEQDLKRAFGEDKASLSHLFNAFLLEKRIKADLQQSLNDIDQGQVFSLQDVMQEARAQYE